MKINLQARAEQIAKQNPGLAAMRPVIEKELLHYDIFFLLQQKELLLPAMTFIGGTCLRLCYGSNRYSEDLDFHAGKDFKPADFDKIRLEIERYLSDRYGLETEVKEPKQLKNDPDYANTNASTWKVIIKTNEGQKHLPQQRIHIDIANVPTHDAKPELIRTNYQELPDGYDAMLMRSSSLNEILADKLVAVPARNNIKARDLWDILWLHQQKAVIDSDLIRKKLSDHEMGNYKDLLEARINEVEAYFEKPFFVTEMTRFLDSERLSQTVGKPEFVAYLQSFISKTLGDVHASLYSEKKTEYPFEL
ncbi:nucleotidyl transferase AbiEii/AbiGii toxin family protein [Vibrio parahaemolyticus]|uniref:nucleotidyl transferase AbiEii/AbiGii toxin family protein n=1 Tax=Vibrio parahaemolyticus TaxID=670 RepID=UPI0023EC9935|nr:nucleotidyl transferase AbiEii/AbiGii toxin family protein [Vibrio parahaemolyticus]